MSSELLDLARFDAGDHIRVLNRRESMSDDDRRSTCKSETINESAISDEKGGRRKEE